VIATPRTQFRAASASERIRSLTLAALNGGSDFQDKAENPVIAFQSQVVSSSIAGGKATL
jgi:hypothetical protein